MGVLTFHDNFRHRIGSLLEGGFTDAILLVEGVEIPVHKCILAVQSEYFSQLFGAKNGSQQTAHLRGVASGSQAITEVGEILTANHQSLVEISDETPPLSDNVFVLKNTKVEVVRAVLDYFYRGEYNYHDNVETHWLALELAHQFTLRDLKQTLINNLVKSITVENFVHFYNMKMRYKNDKMEKSCVSFLKKNGEKIARSENFSKLTRDSLLSLLDEESFAAAEIDIFRAAERWAGVNKPNKNTVKEIVEKIRLATMSQKDLFDVVRYSKELPSIDILEPIQSITNKDAASTNFRQQPPTVTDLDLAKLSVEPEPVNTNFTGSIFGSGGRTPHKVGAKPDNFAVNPNESHSSPVQEIPVTDLNMASFNLGPETMNSILFDAFFGSSGRTSHDKPDNFGVNPNESHSSPEQGIPVASTNVVLASKGATVTGGLFGHNPMDCIDGKEDSYAVVSDFSPLSITLGQPHWLSSVRVKIDAYFYSYTIESSPDGESWQPVGGETKGKWGKVWRTFEFSSRVVMYFRVSAKRISLPYPGIHLYHFESPASK